MLCGWKVTAGLAKSNGSLPPGGWLIVTCGLTACRPGSAPGPTLGNEYGKPFIFSQVWKAFYLFNPNPNDQQSRQPGSDDSWCWTCPVNTVQQLENMASRIDMQSHAGRSSSSTRP